MSEDKTTPKLSAKGHTEADRRRKRQAEALRANLMRRKAQTRSRADDDTTAPDDQDGELSNG